MEHAEERKREESRSVAELATFYTWRSKYGGLEVSEAKRLKPLEEENRKLSKFLTEQMLDAATLREMLAKNF